MLGLKKYQLEFKLAKEYLGQQEELLQMQGQQQNKQGKCRPGMLL